MCFRWSSPACSVVGAVIMCVKHVVRVEGIVAIGCHYGKVVTITVMEKGA